MGLYTQYHEGQYGDSRCYSNEIVDRAEYFEYTAYCMKNCPITIVELWAQASGFSASNTAVIPECCDPNPEHGAPIVQYTFKVSKNFDRNEEQLKT